MESDKSLKHEFKCYFCYRCLRGTVLTSPLPQEVVGSNTIFYIFFVNCVEFQWNFIRKPRLTRVVTGIKDFVPTKETSDFSAVFKKLSSWMTSRLFINVLNIESVVIPTNSGQSASSLLAKTRAFSFNKLKRFLASPPFANTKT